MLGCEFHGLINYSNLLLSSTYCKQFVIVRPDLGNV